LLVFNSNWLAKSSERAFNCPAVSFILPTREREGKKERKGKEWAARECGPSDVRCPLLDELRDGHTSVDIEIRSFCWSVRNSRRCNKNETNEIFFAAATVAV
jgi:hypothetical protein